MNILPKKRWHVRTKENIARVRRDEAQAAEEERQKQQRIKLAESEHRLKLLREKSKQFTEPEDVIPLEPQHHEHVNLFKDLEAGNVETKKINKEAQKEKKDEQEKYEKKIGFLTYLGQDTNEALGKKNWYYELPDRTKSDVEVNIKSKLLDDPLSVMDKYLNKSNKNKPATQTNPDYLADKFVAGTSKPPTQTEAGSNPQNGASTSSKPQKDEAGPSKPQNGASTSSQLPDLAMLPRKRKRCSSDSTDSGHQKKQKRKKTKKKRKHRKRSPDSEDERKRKIEDLRQERMKRERLERAKADALLAKLRGDPEPAPPVKPPGTVQRKYNSQFNPEIAKQNYEDYRRK